MLVLVANNTGREARRLCDNFPDRIGHLIGPGGWRSPFDIFGLDNGRFPVFARGGIWNARAFWKLVRCARSAPTAPRWIAVPDVVMQRDATLASWHHWAPKLRPLGWPLAFVVQNGMTKDDVPGEAAVVFVGGDTQWKQETARYWCEHFPRVHVGRVNGERDLWRYHRAGAESCDGSGWFRGDQKQLAGLWYYLADSEGIQDAAHGPLQPRLFSMGAPAR